MRTRFLRYGLCAIFCITAFDSPALWAQSQGDLVGITPCRVVDTRQAAGTFGGPSIGGGTTRVFPIPAGNCNVPANAVAYSLNVSVVPPGPLGYLTVWPDGQAQPYVATLVDATGLILSNGAIIAAGANGAIDVFASNTTDLVIDIDGYFAPLTIASNESTALGTLALASNTSGGFNTAMGFAALHTNNTGSDNTSVGYYGLQTNTTGNDNTAEGYRSLQNNSIGNSNTAFGSSALVQNSTGSNNIGIGYQAGLNVVNGSNNIQIGGSGPADESGVIRIGTQGTQTSAYIAGISNATVSGAAVLIDSNGQLGVASSSERYKTDIRDMDAASDALMQLHPVTFHYKRATDDGTKPLQYGLIGEEVEKVYPDLVVRGRDGQVESVQYHQLPALLLNEAKKEHRMVQQQQEQIRSLEQRIAALESMLHQQIANNTSVIPASSGR